MKDQNPNIQTSQQTSRGSSLSVWSQPSGKLISCLVMMEIPDRKQEAKMELVSITSELMPKGAPNLLGVIKYPTIERLCQEVGKKGVLLMILALVRDFCVSLNVVRSMNEDQMIEVSSMLLDECGNFRLEDYVMMFAMAKRGQLVKIYDRIDIDLISQIMDEYWFKRNEAGKRAQDEEYNKFETDLKLAERGHGAMPLTPGEENIQQKFYGDLTKLVEKLCAIDPVEAEKEEKERQERINMHNEFFKSTLTPEQLEEIERRRKEIQEVAKKYESGEL